MWKRELKDSDGNRPGRVPGLESPKARATSSYTFSWVRIGWHRTFDPPRGMDAATPTPGAAHQLAGFVRHAFTAAFYHLGQGTDYREALAATLAQGGDTDTNACIVGGLIGALHGIEGIPPEMLDGLLNCDTRKGRMRPDEYTIKPVPDNLGRLGAVLWPAGR